MSFTDHKITAFAHCVADLPDEPQIPAADLKSRFDACPEELRQSLNAVCDDAARLEARVEGIVVDTFGDTIDKEMLSDELAAELDGKATQSALSAEAAARESADSAEAAARTALAETVAQKCELYLGTYTGDGETTRDINIGFTPQAVFIIAQSGVTQAENGRTYGGMAFPNVPCKISIASDSATVIEIVENGFRVQNKQVTYAHMDAACTNVTDTLYLYVAMK